MSPNNVVQRRNALSSIPPKLPLNLLGGHRWLNDLKLEGEIRTAIVRTEIGGSLLDAVIVDGRKQ